MLENVYYCFAENKDDVAELVEKAFQCGIKLLHDDVNNPIVVLYPDHLATFCINHCIPKKDNYKELNKEGMIGKMQLRCGEPEKQVGVSEECHINNPGYYQQGYDYIISNPEQESKIKENTKKFNESLGEITGILTDAKDHVGDIREKRKEFVEEVDGVIQAIIGAFGLYAHKEVNMEDGSVKVVTLTNPDFEEDKLKIEDLFFPIENKMLLNKHKHDYKVLELFQPELLNKYNEEEDKMREKIYSMVKLLSNVGASITRYC